MKKIPVLRFPEFSGEWEEKKLGEITLKVGSGSTPRGGEKVYQSSGIPFIRSQNVNNDFLNLNDLVYIPENINNQMKGSIVKPNDILLNITGASIGRSCIVPFDFEIGNVNQHVCIIRLKQNFNSKFFQLYLSSERGQKSILSSQVGSGREGLNFQAIRSFKIHTPTISEQQKIADFLSQIDRKIEQLSQKKQLLERYKKGVMQQIFSQAIRFKDDDGREFPEWEEKEIGEVFQVTRGNVLAMSLVSNTKNEENPYPVYSSQTKNNGLSGFYRDYLYENCITWTTDGANAGDVNYRNGKFYCTNVCGVLVNKNGFANACIASMINAISKNYVSYVGNPKLMNNVMAKISINFPCIEEQTKIANFLTALDNKIALVEKQLNGTKQYKKGLLQQMFI